MSKKTTIQNLIRSWLDKSKVTENDPAEGVNEERGDLGSLFDKFEFHQYLNDKIIEWSSYKMEYPTNVGYKFDIEREEGDDESLIDMDMKEQLAHTIKTFTANKETAKEYQACIRHVQDLKIKMYIELIKNYADFCLKFKKYLAFGNVNMNDQIFSDIVRNITYFYSTHQAICTLVRVSALWTIFKCDYDDEGNPYWFNNSLKDHFRLGGIGFKAIMNPNSEYLLMAKRLNLCDPNEINDEMSVGHLSQAFALYDETECESNWYKAVHRIAYNHFVSDEGDLNEVVGFVPRITFHGRTEQTAYDIILNSFIPVRGNTSHRTGSIPVYLPYSFNVFNLGGIANIGSRNYIYGLIEGDKKVTEANVTVETEMRKTLLDLIQYVVNRVDTVTHDGVVIEDMVEELHNLIKFMLNVSNQNKLMLVENSAKSTFEFFEEIAGDLETVIGLRFAVNSGIVQFNDYNPIMTLNKLTTRLLSDRRFDSFRLAFEHSMLYNYIIGWEKVNLCSIRDNTLLTHSFKNLSDASLSHSTLATVGFHTNSTWRSYISSSRLAVMGGNDNNEQRLKGLASFASSIDHMTAQLCIDLCTEYWFESKKINNIIDLEGSTDIAKLSKLKDVILKDIPELIVEHNKRSDSPVKVGYNTFMIMDRLSYNVFNDLNPEVPIDPSHIAFRTKEASVNSGYMLRLNPIVSLQYSNDINGGRFFHFEDDCQLFLNLYVINFINRRIPIGRNHAMDSDELWMMDNDRVIRLATGIISRKSIDDSNYASISSDVKNAIKKIVCFNTLLDCYTPYEEINNEAS